MYNITVYNMLVSAIRQLHEGQKTIKLNMPRNSVYYEIDGFQPYFSCSINP